MKGRLYKSRKDKMILGVCGGLSKYFDIDVSIVRIVWAAAALFYGTGVLVYLIAAFILPYEDELDPRHAWEETGQGAEKNASNSSYDQRKVLAGVLIIAGLLLLLKNFRFALVFDMIWPLALIVLGAYLILQGRKNGHEK